MSEAYKCDVVDCGVLEEGAVAGDFVANNLGVRKHMCSKHTDALIESYFPDLKQEEVETPAGLADQGTPGDNAPAA